MRTHTQLKLTTMVKNMTQKETEKMNKEKEVNPEEFKKMEEHDRKKTTEQEKEKRTREKVRNEKTHRKTDTPTPTVAKLRGSKLQITNKTFHKRANLKLSLENN